MSSPILRQRLFDRLDALRERAIVWIVAPPGSGKTTLASSYLAERRIRHYWYQVDAADGDIATFFHYLRQAIQQADRRSPPLPALTPEYLAGLRVFARRYGEALAGKRAAPTTLVLDNYEQLPADAALHGVLQDLAEELPATLGLLVLSRSEPPASFARLQLHERLALVDGASLNLTLDEAQAYARHRSAAPLPERNLSRIEKLHRLSRGWFAGFRLLLDDERVPAIPEDFAGEPNQLLFDYFSTELFERFDPQEQTVLLHTAVLPGLTETDAVELSGIAHAGTFLADLQRRGLFVVQHGGHEPVYEYHPLFRAFLLKRAAESLAPQTWRQLQSRAAELLAEAGRPEAAARLLASIGDWGALTELVLTEAPGLVAAGRYATLTEKLMAIPAPLREASPWLLYWLGTSKTPFDPVAARADFERAFALFDRRDDDAAGLYLTWSSIVESYLAEWRDFRLLDRWICALAALRGRHPRFPSPEIELRVVTMSLPLMFRRVERCELQETVARAFSLLQETQEPVPRQLLAASLLHPVIWLGDFARGRKLATILESAHESADIPPFTSVLAFAYLAAFYSYFGMPKRCVHLVTQAMALAERTGMYAWTFLLEAGAVYGYSALGELDKVAEHLERLKAAMPFHTHLLGGHYHYLAARLAEHRGDLAEALQQGLTSLAMAEDAGSPVPQAQVHVTLASILHPLGRQEEARSYLQQVRHLAANIDSAHLEFLCLITEAHAAFTHSDTETGRQALRSALALSRERGGIGMVFHWGPARAAEMYAKALEAGIETDHALEMIRRSELPAPDSGRVPDNWPWPLRIHVFGHLQIIRDGMKVSTEGKAQQKPLELLMAMLCFRSHEVPKEFLLDTLWPESDGDLAKQALSVNIHRLRKLLGHADALQARDGYFLLDSGRVWVDVWAFERFMAPAEASRNADTGVSAHERCRDALPLYQGEFLQDCQLTCARARRERLRLMFRDQLLRAAGRFEALGDHPSAADCYLRGIAVDETSEAFHQRLIESYLAQDRLAEARDAYRNCAVMLGSQHPSALVPLRARLFAD
ncbi:MAG: hypothetical protein FIA97_11385 [Methylococcaceae bacterium]|nr:hypothetical protein [Methylococcaceae bacterium]